MGRMVVHVDIKIGMHVVVVEELAELLTAMVAEVHLSSSDGPRTERSYGCSSEIAKPENLQDFQ